MNAPDSLGTPESWAWRAYPHTYAKTIGNGKWEAYPHLVHIGREIGDAIEEGGARIIVEVAPRHGKSELISRYTPEWYLSLHPDRRVVLCSYEAGLAASFGRVVRNDAQSNAAVGFTIRGDSHAANRWETTDGGGMITAGIGGAIVGRGGDLLLIDDAVKNWAQAMSPTYRQSTIDWFKTTFYSRCEPNASIVILMQRWHSNDLAGWLQSNDAARDIADRWKVIRLPALAERDDPLGRQEGEALCPQRYTREELLAIKQTMGSTAFNALYQQRPGAEEGATMKRGWFSNFYTTLPDRFDAMVQSWDLTFSDTAASAYVVGQVWGRKAASFYLVDERRDRLDFIGSMRAVAALTQKYPQASAVLVENKANGPALIAAMKSKIPGLIPIEPRGSKEARAMSVSPIAEAGQIWLPSKVIAPWIEDWLDEICAFPRHELKDRMDAMSQALSRLSRTAAAKVSFESITKSSMYGS